MSDFGRELMKVVVTRAATMEQRANDNRSNAKTQLRDSISVLKQASEALIYTNEHYSEGHGAIKVGDWINDKISGAAICTTHINDPALARTHTLTIKYNEGMVTIEGLDDKAAAAIHTPNGRIRAQTPSVLQVLNTDWNRLPSILEGFLLRYFS